MPQELFVESLAAGAYGIMKGTKRKSMKFSDIGARTRQQRGVRTRYVRACSVACVVPTAFPAALPQSNTSCAATSSSSCTVRPPMPFAVACRFLPHAKFWR
jgi:hypothetical protein